jgi:regulator of cell morphogenesis and NO signaling
LHVVLIKQIKMDTDMKTTLEENPQTVAELAISQPGALAIFTKYNIDYCCGGHRSIEDACRRIGLDPEKIIAEILQSSQGASADTIRPESWSSALLIDYIIGNHHSYVRNAIPEVQAFMDKVCEAHGSDCRELLEIRENFIDLSDELISHMEKEELVVFPWIKNLEAEKSEDQRQLSRLQGPIGAMEHEHVIAGDLVKAIRSLSGNYTPPDFACPTFKIAYKKLQEFENDLMRHIHLENNILFERMKGKEVTNGSCAL